MVIAALKPAPFTVALAALRSFWIAVGGTLAGDGLKVLTASSFRQGMQS